MLNPRLFFTVDELDLAVAETLHDLLGFEV